MVGYQESDNIPPIYSTKSFVIFFKTYKYPLIFTLLGILFITIGVVLTFKSLTNNREVVFEKESDIIGTKKQIIVDVSGAVEKPGVYSLAVDSRIKDALIASGGLSYDADRDWIAKNLNQAAVVNDGGKIYIPKINENSQSPQPWAQNKNLLGVTTKLININTASKALLDTLSGVGEVTAKKIIDNRPYQSIEDLKTKKIINNSLFEKIKDLITVF